MTHHGSAEISLQSVSCYCHRSLFTTNFYIYLPMHISVNVQVTYTIIHYEMSPCKAHSLLNHSANVKRFQLFLPFNVAVNATISPLSQWRQFSSFLQCISLGTCLCINRQALPLFTFVCLLLCYCSKK